MKQNRVGMEFAIIFGFGVIMILLAISGITGCRTPMPKIDITAWIGDSEKNGITRSSEDRTIQCNDPQFDEYVCISGADLTKIYNTLLQCKQWGPPVAN